MDAPRLRLVIIIGYYDTFSGYQEVGLARSLATHHEVHVIAGDRVNPIFTDEHLARIGVPRKYAPGATYENGVRVTRMRCVQVRSTIWAAGVRRLVRGINPDLIVQMMPGQGLAALATPETRDTPSVIVFGDNRAMWNKASPLRRRLKSAVFKLTKGALYKYAARHANRTLVYTPNTERRIAPYVNQHSIDLFPLAYDERVFFHDVAARAEARRSLAIDSDAEVILLVGKYGRSKRFEESIEAFRILRQQRPKVFLLIVGPSARDLSMDGNPLNECMRIEPFASPCRLNELLNAADIGVWPAMPAITIQQAMGTGLYVVVPDNDLVGHLVRSEVTGLKVEDLQVKRPDELAGLLNEALGCAKQEGRVIRAQENSWLSSSAAATYVSNLLLKDAE